MKSNLNPIKSNSIHIFTANQSNSNSLKPRDRGRRGPRRPYVCMYIYIYREREIYTYIDLSLSICVYIYIHTH